MDMTRRLAASLATACLLMAATGCGASAARSGYSGGGGEYAPAAEPAYYPGDSAGYAEYEESYELEAVESDSGGAYWGGWDDGDDVYAEAMAPPPGPATTSTVVPAKTEQDKYAQAALSGDEGEPTSTETKTDAGKGGKKPDRIILYEGELSIAVFRVDEKLDEIRDKVKGWDGYMISMGSDRITFRVPAENFEEALEDLEDMGDVTYRHVSGTDVTDEYRDLQIRLGNAIAVRDRLIELLSQAKTIEESLKVEHELERITEKIELMKGRLKYLSEAAAYSKITVHLAVKQKTKKPLPPLYAPFKWIQDVGLDTLFSF